METINNINMLEIKPLIRPKELIFHYPSDNQINNLVKSTRREISDIIYKKSEKKLLIIGPCSIHDTKQGYDYAVMLKKLSDKVKNKILIVMRVYFEKPRTTVGWKGLINDPDLNNTFNVNKGLLQARELLYRINKLGLPCAYEILDTITTQYIIDLISWERSEQGQLKAKFTDN